jgi:acetyl-CoA C-acetyltransferase
MSQARTVILSAARTPFAKLGGGLSSLSGPELGTHAAAAALERSGVAPGDIGYVVMGEVLQAGAGQIPSRQVSVGIGLGPTVGSETINKVCASGMRAATRRSNGWPRSSPSSSPTARRRPGTPRA